MLMKLTVLLAMTAAGPVAAAADTDRGACARLRALLEVADLSEGAEDIHAIAAAGDDAACARALERLNQGGTAVAPEETSAKTGCGTRARD